MDVKFVVWVFSCALHFFSSVLAYIVSCYKEIFNFISYNCFIHTDPDSKQFESILKRVDAFQVR